MKLKLKISYLLNVVIIFALIAISIVLYFLSTYHLEQRLELNLRRTASTIGNILDSKKQFIDKDSANKEYDFEDLRNSDIDLYNEISSKWKDYFDKNMLNPFNYYIRIYDKKTRLIWYTNNIIFDTDDKSDNFTIYEFTSILDSIAKRPNTPPFISYDTFENALGNKSQVIFRSEFNNKTYNILVEKYKDYVISIGQPYDFFYYYSATIIYSMIFICLCSILLLNMLLYFLFRHPFSNLAKLNDEISKIQINHTNSRLETDYKYSELNNIAKTINNTIDNVESSFQRLNKFSAEVAHELKTPLTILRGELTLALQGKKSVIQYQQTIASALEESIRMTDVIEALLDLARAETGQAKLFKKHTDLSFLIEDIIEDFEILADEKNIFLKSYIEKNINIEIDPARIRQAILNIVENSIKYTPEKGIITIELKKINNYAVINICDTGIGIPADKITSIFESFYRTDEVKMKNIQGLGLGLTMVKWIIDSHNGIIEVRSKVDEGSVFSVKLPINS